MKKVIMMFALFMGIVSAQAQENKTAEENGSDRPAQEVKQEEVQELSLSKEIYPQKEADGDLYHGLTRKLTFDRMIPPHGLEVTYNKTVHIIFPSEVRYVDLGSPNLIAGKADGAENVIRVKATVRNFQNETNMSVITEDGGFYTFNVKYAEEPLLLNVEMCDFIHDGEAVNRPNNAMEIYLKELGNESPMLVRLIMKSIHRQTRVRCSISAASVSVSSISSKASIRITDFCISIRKSRTRATCRLTWTTSHGKSWTRRWQSVQPCRNRSFFRSVRRTM